MREARAIPDLIERLRSDAHESDWSDFVQSLHALGMFEGMQRPAENMSFLDQIRGLIDQLDDNPQLGISLACMSIVSALACASQTLAELNQQMGDMLTKMCSDLDEFGDEPMFPQDRKNFSEAVSNCIPHFRKASAHHQRDCDELASASTSLAGGDQSEYIDYLQTFRVRKDADAVSDIIKKSNETGEPIDPSELPTTIRGNIDLEALTALLKEFNKALGGES
jgi:hypothetical protein